MKKKHIIKTVLAVVVIIVIGCANMHTEIDIKNDGENTVMVKSDKILDERYMEILVVKKDATDNSIYAQCYNTTGFNGPDSKNSAPQALVAQLNPKEISKEYDGVSTFINGPRVWCIDYSTCAAGEVREFGGLKARWVAKLEMKDPHIFDKAKPAYYISEIQRTTVFGIEKGTDVFLLDDADGNTWVMKSYSLVIDSTMTREKVPAMMAKLKLPEGWSYRVVTLDKELILKPESGVARIVTDDADNVYDQVGPGYSNYIP